jgi:hypothetical protein
VETTVNAFAPSPAKPAPGVDFAEEIWEAQDGCAMQKANRDPPEGKAQLMLLRTYRLSWFSWIAFGGLLIFLTAVRLSGQKGAAKVLEPGTALARVAAGVESQVQVTLAVKEGFKVAKRPAPKLQMMANEMFEVAVIDGFGESAPGKDPEYFGKFNPIGLRVLPAKTTKTGKYSLEGKVTYFYCSEQEKYCSRSVAALTIPLEVIDKK